MSAIAPYPQVLTGMLMTRARPQDYLVIEGGVPLTGTIRPEGNKNAALPLLAATLLTAEPVVLGNMPRIRDVETMLELLADLGAEVEWTRRERGARVRGRRATRRRSTSGSPSASARRSCWPARCSRASAAPTCRCRAAT